MNSTELGSAEWAYHQWGTCDFGDRRLTARAVAMGARIAAAPGVGLPRQMGTWPALVGAYRFLDNAHVTFETLLQPHWDTTRAAAGQVAVALLVQDWTTLDYSAHPKTQGIGPVGSRSQRGMLLHSVLAIEPTQRQVLGLAYAQVIIRAEDRPQPKGSKRHAGAEGQAWERAVAQIGAAPAGVTWVHVSDRESDIFEYLVACRTAGKHFVVRAFHNRLLPEGETEVAEPHFLDYVRTWPADLDPAKGYTVEVDATETHPKRRAAIVVSWRAVTLPPPSYVKGVAPLAVYVVRAWEPNPPAGADAVEWILLTSWPVTGLADACQVVHWYECRWLVEDYHMCLKTGCRVEQAQLDEGLDLQRLLGFLAPVAVRLLQLRQAVRVVPDVPAVTLVDPLTVKLLAAYFHKPAPTWSLKDFWRSVAQLGGYLGRKSDGPPGWRTLWKGWQQLSDWTTGARLSVT
jgi:Transposase DNA-binding/Transposase Tn5 dimerisation domain